MRSLFAPHDNSQSCIVATGKTGAQLPPPSPRMKRNSDLLLSSRPPTNVGSNAESSNANCLKVIEKENRLEKPFGATNDGFSEFSTDQVARDRKTRPERLQAPFIAPADVDTRDSGHVSPDKVHHAVLENAMNKLQLSPPTHTACAKSPRPAQRRAPSPLSQHELKLKHAPATVRKVQMCKSCKYPRFSCNSVIQAQSIYPAMATFITCSSNEHYSCYCLLFPPLLSVQ